MSYKAIPFQVKVGSKGTDGDVANQVQSVIDQNTNDGWEFVSCGNIDTAVAGSNGCFGIGATAATSTSVMVLIFKKWNTWYYSLSGFIGSWFLKK